MATVTLGANNTLIIHLTALEAQIISMVSDDALAQYITLWLENKTKHVFNTRFAKLSPADQALVLAKFMTGGAP